jgi:hypothetical protein
MLFHLAEEIIRLVEGNSARDPLLAFLGSTHGSTQARHRHRDAPAKSFEKNYSTFHNNGVYNQIGLRELMAGLELQL